MLSGPGSGFCLDPIKLSGRLCLFWSGFHCIQAAARLAAAGSRALRGIKLIYGFSSCQSCCAGSMLRRGLGSLGSRVAQASKAAIASVASPAGRHVGRCAGAVSNIQITAEPHLGS